MFDAKKVKDDIINWIRDWFKLNGNGCNCIVGISGGVDSSVVAALCVEALGKDRVLGVMMPQGKQSDMDDSFMLCNHLDIDRVIIPIGHTVNCLEYEILTSMEGTLEEQTKINMPPRIRMVTLYAVSQSYNGRVANTCNLSEDWIGYNTIFGDSVGDFSPLSRLTKTEVKLIGYELGLPKKLIEKLPDDGLPCSQPDEIKFGFTYDILDKYIRTGICEDEDVKKKIDTMHEKNKFKLEPMSCFEYNN